MNITHDAVPAAQRCEHDSSNGANPYVDGDASFWAHVTHGLQLIAEQRWPRPFTPFSFMVPVLTPWRGARPAISDERGASGGA